MFVEAVDGAQLFVRDWGAGRPVVLVHSWGVDSMLWQYQIAFLLERGCRCIAFDRRGHGKSSQPGSGYDLDTLADDLAAVIAASGLDGVTLIGHSMAAAEIARYLTRHGAARVARVALVAPTAPCVLRSADNPDGIDRAVFDATHEQWRHDFPGWIAANARPFFAPETSQAMVDWGVAMIAQTPVPIAIATQRAAIEVDQRAELRALTVATLVIHGTNDASAPLALSGAKTAALIPGAELRVYEGAPHGLMFTHTDRLNADLLRWIETGPKLLRGDV